MFQLEIGKSKLRKLLESISTDERAKICLNQGIVSFEMLNCLYEEYWKERYNMKEIIVHNNIKFKEKHISGSGYCKEFKEELERLRGLEEEKAYQNMIGKEDIFEDEKGVKSIAEMNKEIKEQVSAVMNVVFTVFGSVYAVWYATGYGWDIHLRILLCIFSGILVLIADVVMYNAYYRKIEEARKVERGKKQLKRVVKRLV